MRRQMLQKEVGCSGEKERRTSLEEEDRLGVVTRVQGRTRGAGEGRDHQWVEDTSEDRRGGLSCETRRRLSSTENNTGRIAALRRRIVPLTERVTVMRTGSSLLYARHYCKCLTGGDVGGMASPAPGLKGDSPPEQGKHGGRWLCGRRSMLTSGQERKQSQC